MYTGAVKVVEHGFLLQLLSKVFSVSKRREGLSTESGRARPCPALPCPARVPPAAATAATLPHLLGLLVEHRGHGEDGAAFVQGSGEALPLLVQLGGDLLDLLRGIMAGLREAGGHGHDAVDVDVGILKSTGE